MFVSIFIESRCVLYNQTELANRTGKPNWQTYLASVFLGSGTFEAFSDTLYEQDFYIFVTAEV